MVFIVQIVEDMSSATLFYANLSEEKLNPKKFYETNDLTFYISEVRPNKESKRDRPPFVPLVVFHGEQRRQTTRIVQEFTGRFVFRQNSDLLGKVHVAFGHRRVEEKMWNDRWFDQRRNRSADLSDLEQSHHQHGDGIETKSLSLGRGARRKRNQWKYSAAHHFPAETTRTLRRVSHLAESSKVRRDENSREKSASSVSLRFSRLVELIWAVLIDQLLSEVENPVSTVKLHRTSLDSVSSSFLLRFSARLLLTFVWPKVSNFCWNFSAKKSFLCRKKSWKPINFEWEDDDIRDQNVGHCSLSIFR